MPEYNKLIRDGVPEIIIADGMTPVTRTLTNDNEYELELITKIGEEWRELAQADTTEKMEEELADLREVLDALAEHISSKKRIEEIQARKAKERGGFLKRIFLIRTE